MYRTRRQTIDTLSTLRLQSTRALRPIRATVSEYSNQKKEHLSSTNWRLQGQSTLSRTTKTCGIRYTGFKKSYSHIRFMPVPTSSNRILKGWSYIENGTLTGQPRQKMVMPMMRRSSQTPSSLKFYRTYSQMITQWWHWNFTRPMGMYRRIFWVSICTRLWEINSHM